MFILFIIYTFSTHYLCSPSGQEEGQATKWTGRGTGHCPRCTKSYSNAWKPKTCSECNYEIGGKYVPNTTSKKRKLEWPESVPVVDSQLVRIYSVKLDHRTNRVFVLKDDTMLSVTMKIVRRAEQCTWQVL